MWKFIDKFGLFLVNLFRAIKFSILDYDSGLKRTKTLKYRIIFWSVTGIMFTFFIIVILKIFGDFFQTMMRTKTNQFNPVK